MNNVTFRRKDFANMLPRWGLIDDVVGGEDAVKAREETYLPMPNPLDSSEENLARYKSYLLRAVFYPVVGRTLSGLTGSAFKKAPVQKVPKALEFILADVDGAGVSLAQQAQKTVKAVLGKGRNPLFVDYPKTEGSVSLADKQSGAIRPTIISIPCHRVINWRSTRIGSVYKTSLVVIEESYAEVSEDGFGSDVKNQYRVLRLEDGLYTIDVYRQADGKQEWIAVPELRAEPKKGNGQRWTEIPFVIPGSENNDPDIDEAPLLDMSQLNLAHYRNSADYEDSVFFCGQAQAYISGLDEEWRDHLEKGGFYVGARIVLPLPTGGSFGFAQASPNTLAKEAMDQKEEQLLAIGARLITPGSAVKTVFQVQSESASEHSVLSLVVENVSRAYEKCLQWCAEYDNVSGDVEFQINTDFINAVLDPAMLTALTGAFNGGIMPDEIIFDEYRRTGLVKSETTNEEIREMIESSSTGLAIDFDEDDSGDAE